MAQHFAMSADTEERSAMYSPKIKEELIPVLYRLAKEMEIPMTRLVNSLIEKSLDAIERSKDHEHDLSQSI
jgi:hypothetical protein